MGIICRKGNEKSGWTAKEILPERRTSKMSDKVKNPCKEIEITISSKIMVDECIAKEIAYLNSLGVRTRHSCCGHGKESAYALIEPGYHIPERAKELGYEPYFSDPNEDGRGFTVIDLKSKCQCDTD